MRDAPQDAPAAAAGASDLHVFLQGKLQAMKAERQELERHFARSPRRTVAQQGPTDPRTHTPPPSQDAADSEEPTPTKERLAASRRRGPYNSYGGEDVGKGVDEDHGDPRGESHRAANGGRSPYDDDDDFEDDEDDEVDDYGEDDDGGHHRPAPARKLGSGAPAMSLSRLRRLDSSPRTSYDSDVAAAEHVYRGASSSDTSRSEANSTPISSVDDERPVRGLAARAAASFDELIERELRRAETAAPGSRAQRKPSTGSTGSHGSHGSQGIQSNEKRFLRKGTGLSRFQQGPAKGGASTARPTAQRHASEGQAVPAQRQRRLSSTALAAARQEAGLFAEDDWDAASDTSFHLSRSQWSKLREQEEQELEEFEQLERATTTPRAGRQNHVSPRQKSKTSPLSKSNGQMTSAQQPQPRQLLPEFRAYSNTSTPRDSIESLPRQAPPSDGYATVTSVDFDDRVSWGDEPAQRSPQAFATAATAASRHLAQQKKAQQGGMDAVDDSGPDFDDDEDEDDSDHRSSMRSSTRHQDTRGEPVTDTSGYHRVYRNAHFGRSAVGRHVQESTAFSSDEEDSGPARPRFTASGKTGSVAARAGAGNSEATPRSHPMARSIDGYATVTSVDFDDEDPWEDAAPAKAAAKPATRSTTTRTSRHSDEDGDDVRDELSGAEEDSVFGASDDTDVEDDYAPFRPRPRTGAGPGNERHDAKSSRMANRTHSGDYVNVRGNDDEDDGATPVPRDGERRSASPPRSNLVNKLFHSGGSTAKRAVTAPGGPRVAQPRLVSAMKQPTGQLQQQQQLQQQERPAANGSAAQSVDPAPLNSVVKEKLEQLEAEIARYKSANSEVEHARSEYDRKFKQLEKDVDEFEAVKEEELKNLREYKNNEMRKLKRERKVFDMYKDAAKEHGDPQSRQEIEALRSELASLKEEMARRDQKAASAAARSKDRIERLTARNDELEQEVRALEQERLKLWEQQEHRAATPTATTASKSSKPKMSSVGVMASFGEAAKTDSPTQSAPEPSPSVPVALRTSGSSKQRQVLADGTKVEVFENGTRKETLPSGELRVHFFNGDFKNTLATGQVVYFYAETNTKHTTFPDGTQILEFPNGQVEKNFTNGMQEISFPDGTVKTIFSNGEEETVFPDKTVQRLMSNGERIIDFPNGQSEIHTAEFKKRRYPDGTIKIVYPDGRQETKYASGRVRVKDADGFVILDTVPSH
eukprot:m.41553 g.41553  ORF g.41553 m.41553 type:complete len:1210 (+) comp6048_c0_seq1:171-3800(+)